MDWANTFPVQKNGLWLLTVCVTWKTLNWLAGTVILRLKPFLFQTAESCIPGITGMPKVISIIPKIKKFKTKYLGWKLVYKKCLSKILYKNITASTCWPKMSGFGTHSPCFHVIKWHIKVAMQMRRTVSLNSPIYVFLHPSLYISRTAASVADGQASEWSFPSTNLCVGNGGRSEEHSACLESLNHTFRSVNSWICDFRTPNLHSEWSLQRHLIRLTYGYWSFTLPLSKEEHGETKDMVFLWRLPFDAILLTPKYWSLISTLLFSLEYVFHISLLLSEQKQSELQNPRTTNYELPWAFPSRFQNSSFKISELSELFFFNVILITSILFRISKESPSHSSQGCKHVPAFLVYLKSHAESSLAAAQENKGETSN